MQFSFITAVVLYLFVGLVGIYDLVALYFWGPESTITSVVLEVSKNYPILPFMIGIVIGHLLWPHHIRH